MKSIREAHRINNEMNNEQLATSLKIQLGAAVIEMNNEPLI